MKIHVNGAMFLCFLLVICSQIHAEENYSFRKTRWGMSPDEVKASEPLEVAHSNEEMIGYKTRVLQKDVLLVYIFADKKLVRSKYILAESHSNKTDFIQDYKDFQKILTEKYGKPRNDETIWKDDLYKKNPREWGMAVATGQLLYYSVWDTSDSQIACFLHGDNFDITCGVEYASKELKPMEQQIERQKQLNSF